MRPITKAVIAVAGYGTRFLPATKNQPKEMLPIIDKPITQYLVEEAVASGIKDVILVTRAGQVISEDHFDSHVELEHYLEKVGKKEALEKIREIPRMANFIYVRQKADLPYGNAAPLLAVASLIDNDEAFVYMFGDDLVRSKKPATQQLIEVFEKERPAAVLAVQETPWEEIDRYATVEYQEKTQNNQIVRILEKMPKDQALSNMAQFGRFVFSYKVVEEAFHTPLGKGGELWVADVLNRLASKEVVIAQPIDGEWLTTGDPLRFLKAVVKFALDREDIGEEFREFLREIGKDLT